MGMYYKLSSTCRVKIPKKLHSLPEYREKVREIFKEFKSDQGHRHSVEVTETPNGIEVEMSYSEYGPYSTAQELDAAWKKFVRENADFSAGPVECSGVNDDAPDEESRESIWYIGPADAIIRVRINSIDAQIKELQSERRKLEKKAKNAGSEIIDTDPE